VGKFKTAETFAKLLNCEAPVEGEPCGICSQCKKADSGNHPDIIIIRPEGNSIKIGQMRALQEKIYFRCYEGKFKVIMIDDADLMTIEAANSLLKILEEPPESTVYILIAGDINKLPATIQSRCQAVPFSYIDDTVIGQVLKEKEIDVSFPLPLAQGSLGRAMELAENVDNAQSWGKVKEIFSDIKRAGYKELFAWAEILEKDKELLEIFLDWMPAVYRDRLIWLSTGEEDYLIKSGIDYHVGGSMEDCFTALEKIDNAVYNLKSNGNPRLTIEVLLINLKNIEQKERGVFPQ
jgi:DNA polymerase-3 subunit delta'